MPQVMYCRYCRQNVPMLDEAGFASVSEIYFVCVRAVKHYREEQGTSLDETPLDELYRPVREKIEQITATSEFSVEEVVRRHRLARWT